MNRPASFAARHFTRGYRSTVRALCCVLFATSATPAAIAQAPQPATPESRLAAVETLIERSSAAQQVEASGKAEATERREQARAALKAAQEAQRAGDAKSAERLLGDARRLMMEAARLASAQRLSAEKAKVDFDRRLQSTRALLDAQRRVSAEKGPGAGAEDAIRTVEQRLSEAMRLHAAGRIDGARDLLDQAYLIAKASVGSMRTGDTLVRSLSFATKEEEYRYEMDRNETHQMLVRVLLQGRQQSAAGQAAVASLVQRATSLRTQAEEAGRRGDHAAGVQLLEESTNELVKAIRGAGVYIPG